MASTKPPYDPVKTVEGMFNGSVTRIAYAMKDPLNYAQSTKAILAETAKKFQDALDDCEVQILDAKWHLERQLALNKARREAKAKEESAANAKRKRDESKDLRDSSQSVDRESASKRVKTDEPEEPLPSVQAIQPTIPPQVEATPPITPASLPHKSPVKSDPTKSKEPDKAKDKGKPKPPTSTPVQQPPSSQPEPKQSQNTPAKVPPKQPKPTESAPPPPPPESVQTQFPPMEASLQDTPATANEDFNFVSMFGDASAGDLMDSSNNQMQFNLNFDVDPDGMTAGQDPSQTSLLRGLESYANQSGDDNSFNLGAAPEPSDLNNMSQSYPQGSAMTTDFGLPTLGPNEFDEFLNSNDMNFDTALDDGMLNMDNMDSMEIDFDSMFK
ncbi:hypothetical protein B0A52_01289 [Exophiala mesophila]|uniref:Uncharacterized protein n=1 Tax=Exophiala mesophila TaxID=212818 RepID=A0A438NH06_EXOME|nr:hypothetical protein B0A52_01289 [Exophiala mesophila]